MRAPDFARVDLFSANRQALVLPSWGAIVMQRNWKAGQTGLVSRRVAAALSMLVAFASPSYGQQQGTPEERQACTPDAFRLCGNFIPDADKITACLKNNRDQLSPECKLVFSGKPPRGPSVIPGRRGSVR